MTVQRTLSSAYKPHPGKGESPTRPGALKGGPEVETPAAKWPHLSRHKTAKSSSSEFEYNS